MFILAAVIDNEEAQHSGKIAEITVRDIINGMKVKNLEALANPVCLSEYENIEELNN